MSWTFNAGELKHRIRIQRKKTSKDAKGNIVTEWIDFGATAEKPEVYRWAKWVWLHGDEFYSASAIQSKVMANVTIRYVSGISEDMVILYNGKRYGILPPINNIKEENKIITFKVYTIEKG
jgi:SPP1 family predicted phage head-tail adaptor